MIRIELETVAGQMTFRWACDTCHVDDQAIDPDEGFDSIIWHLRHYHTGLELAAFAVRMSKGLEATAQIERVPQ